MAFPPTLPHLLADRGQLETALVNLGTNARDAMPGGGVLTISAAPELVAEGADHPACLAAGAYVRIDVADNGAGMDEATLARVIEPFYTTKPVGKGTGLGLPLVKGFTEQSGGGMAIQSAVGVGTTVSMWLRQAGAEVPGADAPGAAPLQQAARPAMANLRGAKSARILVVDDDDLVRETMAEQLKGAGYSVATACGGIEALGVIQSGWLPEAMVCDLSMPGIDGIETIKQARELLPLVPCFLLTGYAGERAVLESGAAFKLLRKPISVSALITHIDAGLAARHAPAAGAPEHDAVAQRRRTAKLMAQ
jgi:CheY-like chemotaxis protein